MNEVIPPVPVVVAVPVPRRLNHVSMVKAGSPSAVGLPKVT